MPRRASAYAYLKMSDHVYQGDRLQKDHSVPDAQEWVVKEKLTGPAGFFAVVYENVQQKQRVLAFRGTDIKGTTWTDAAGAVWEDIAGVVFNGNSPHKEAAFKAVDDAVSKAQKEGYEISFTGHSLGAFLASVSVFYCHRYLDYPQAFAVTFENPGPREAMEKLKSTLQSTLNLEVLDITTYQSYPNRINTYGRQVGSVYTTDSNIGNWGKVPGFFLGRSHGTSEMVKYFETNQNNPKLQLLTDWPLGNQRDVFFKESDFKDGQYQPRVKFSAKSDDELEKAIGKRRAGELKASWQQQTFNLEVVGHFQSNPKYDNHTSLALRHFSSTAQAFLKTFHKGLIDIAKDPEKLKKLKERWKEINIDPKVAECLLNFYLTKDTFDARMLCLRQASDIHEFQSTLETWLADARNAKSAAELLTLNIVSNDDRIKVMGMLVKRGARAKSITVEEIQGLDAQIPENVLNKDNPMEDIYGLLDKIKNTIKEIVGIQIDEDAEVGDVKLGSVTGLRLGVMNQYIPADGSGSGSALGKRKAEEGANKNAVKKK